MKRQDLKGIIKESIREVIQEDTRDLVADQLANVADDGGFKNAKDFAKQIGNMPLGDNLNPKLLEKIYNEYMSMDARKRMSLSSSDKSMYSFLSKFGLK